MSSSRETWRVWFFLHSKGQGQALTVLSEQGKEAVVGILEPGQFFGEGCLNGHTLRIATATAMEECVITSITKDAMIATLHAEPKFPSCSWRIS
jgi:CRP-like cAMP-binding protein